PPRLGPAVQRGNAVLIDIEVLPDQLAEQLPCSLDRLVLQQPVGLLDREQRALRVLRYPGQHPLPLRLDPPLTVRLLTRLRVVEHKPGTQRPTGILIGR